MLMFCTDLTVQIAFFDLGALNTVAALAIAVFKATLVVLFFMHVQIQHAAHMGRRARQPLLARDPAGADDGRLPDAEIVGRTYG